MPKVRDKGIIIYGTQEDRDKLSALAQLAGKSSSEYLINLLRENYWNIFGEADPKSINMKP